MKKLLISILAFIFSPIIKAINLAQEKIVENQNDWVSALGSTLIGRYENLMSGIAQLEQRQLEGNYFLGGKAKTDDSDEELGIMHILSNMVQQLNHIGRKAAMPLIFTAKGVVINVIQCKKIMFECSWDNMNILRFLLMVDGTNADTFEYNLENISLDPEFSSSPDKPILDFARVFLKKHTTLTNGRKNVSIIDHIATNASRLLISYVPQKDILFHTDINMICFRSIISAVTPFYEKDKAENEASKQSATMNDVEQPKEDQNNEEKVEQTNIFPLNDAGRTDVAEQPEQKEQ